jgi:phage baseplate assembly protein W
MAYVIGNRILKDTDPSLQSRAYGITLPVKRGVNGFFEQGFTSYEQAKSNLRNLLSTRRGERVMQPLFGSGLHSLLFEQMDSDFEFQLEQEITNSVALWLPYIKVNQIDIELTDEMRDRNMARINITFSVGTQIETDNVTFVIRG